MDTLQIQNFEGNKTENTFKPTKLTKINKIDQKRTKHGQK